MCGKGQEGQREARTQSPIVKNDQPPIVGGSAAAAVVALDARRGSRRGKRRSRKCRAEGGGDGGGIAAWMLCEWSGRGCMIYEKRRLR